LGLFWGALFRDETFVERDLHLFYRPAKSLIAPLTRLSEGIPQWNPLFASGQPFAANPEHEIFHPLTTLFLFLPFEWAFRCQVMVPLLFAVFAMFVLLRTLHRGRGASLFGGLAWGFGGYQLSVTNLLPILFATAVLPLAVAFVLRVARDARPLDAVGLALSVALLGLTGEPTTFLMALVFMAAALCMSGPAGRWGNGPPRFRSRWRVGLLIGFGLIMGIALAGAALVPGIHHAAKTIRASGVSAFDANGWSMPAVRILDFLTPYSLGHGSSRDPAAYWGHAYYRDHGRPFLYSLYPGLVTTFLAAIAWWTRLRRPRHRWALLPWLAVAAVGLVVAMGENFPLWGLLRRFPGLASVRFPEKFALLAVFPVVVASAFGFDQVLGGPARGRRGLIRALAVFAGTCVLLSIILAVASRASVGTVAHSAQVASRDFGRQGLFAFGFLLLLRFGRRFQRSDLGLLVCAGLALDLGTSGKELVPTVSVDRVAMAPPHVQALLQQPGRELLFDEAAFDTSLIVGAFPTPPMYATWGLATTLDIDFDLTQLRWTHESLYLFWEAVNKDRRLLEPLLLRRGVTAWLKYVPGVYLDHGQLRWPSDRPAPIEVLRPPGQSLFAFAASSVESVHGGDGWLSAVRRHGPAAARVACVDNMELSAFPSVPGPATVTVIERRPMAVVLSVGAEGPGPSFIAINQTWDAGWHATIDGVASQVYRTEIDLSGLVVAPGQHQVVLAYDDPSVRLGIIVSSLAAMVLLGVVLFTRSAAARPLRRT